MRAKPSALLVGAAVLALAACGTGDAGGSSTASAGASASSSVSGSITVFAAASLKESFTAIGTAFEAEHPGTRVTFNFGASSALAQQITQGAPADVFASASPTTMQQVVDGKAANGSTAFARNVLEIAVPPNDPAKVAGLGDLGRAGVKVVLCQPQVPCGALAQTVLGKAGVTVKPASLEADVKSTLSKVQLGEADAALVYVTDVTSAGDTLKGIEIPADVNAATTYPIATLTGSKNPDLATAFVTYVLSEGRAELTKVGFQAP
ncbi:MAG TPA: molybdate ABC transporter substrate-binding protein [Kineosporiaceae bacterium]|nr:molybdate ABC transporter substrate-binding protein [Kineosporiaceae bacterium]